MQNTGVRGQWTKMWNNDYPATSQEHLLVSVRCHRVAQACCFFLHHLVDKLFHVTKILVVITTSKKKKRLHVPNARGLGSIPGEGTRSCVLQLRPNTAKLKKICYTHTHTMFWLHTDTSDGMAFFIQFSHSVVSDSLRPHELQHARLPCPSSGVGDGQGGLACCSSWDHRESDMTERLNWSELIPWLVDSVEVASVPLRLRSWPQSLGTLLASFISM